MVPEDDWEGSSKSSLTRRVEIASGPTLQGTVVEPLPNATYKVQLADGRSVLAHTDSQLRKTSVRILVGAKVEVALSAYDQRRARIVKLLS